MQPNLASNILDDERDDRTENGCEEGEARE